MPIASLLPLLPLLPVLLVPAQSTSPSKLALSYAPAPPTACPPDTQLIRSVHADSANISSQELQFIHRKDLSHQVSSYLSSLANYVDNNLPGTSLPNYLSPNASDSQKLSPRIGLSLSGGGHRAAIFGLSVLHALDARNSSSVDSGLGGVLQLSLYMAGLSGGSWAVGSLAQANFPSIPDIFFGPSSPPTDDSQGNGAWGGWNADLDILIASNLSYIAVLLEGMSAKAASFPVSFTDLWSLGLARHFMNGTTRNNFFDESASVHGAAVTFSDIADLPSAQDGSMPFPIVVVNSLQSSTPNGPNEFGAFVPLSNTLFEFNPYEFGSWDPNLASFTPIKFIGSSNNTACVTGFAKAAFVLGTSSNLFNEFNVSATALANSTAGPGISIVNATFVRPQSGNLQSRVELDAAVWPNPFKGINPNSFAPSPAETLSLVDGGENGEVIPLAPLLVKERNLDVIIAIDGSNDRDGFARGGSLVASRNRTTKDSSLGSVYRLPPVPSSPASFAPVAEGGQGLAQRPTFFGCGEFTSLNGTKVTVGGNDTPIVIYLANGAPPPGQAPLTNTSTTQTVYPNEQIAGMFSQTVDIVQQGFLGIGNITKDPEWPLCLACVIFESARLRAVNVARASQCDGCFSRYCWDGTETAATSTSTSPPPSSSNGAYSVSSASLFIIGTLFITIMAWVV